MSEGVGIVCSNSKCAHFNYAFDYGGPIVLLDIQKAGEGRKLPTVCESCGASLSGTASSLRPESERAQTAREAARVKREAVRKRGL